MGGAGKSGKDVDGIRNTNEDGVKDAVEGLATAADKRTTIGIPTRVETSTEQFCTAARRAIVADTAAHALRRTKAGGACTALMRWANTSKGSND